MNPIDYRVMRVKQYDAIQKACIRGADLLTACFKIPQAIADEFSLAVGHALTVELSAEIEEIEKRTADAQNPLLTVEDLATAELALQSIETQIERLEESVIHAPAEMQAVVGCMIPLMQQQRDQAAERARYIRQALESQNIESKSGE